MERIASRREYNSQKISGIERLHDSELLDIYLHASNTSREQWLIAVCLVTWKL